MHCTLLWKKLRARMVYLVNRSNRRLFYELVRAEFKMADSNSTWGVMWSLLGPLATLAVMLAIFKTFSPGVREYPLYLLLGISCVNFFLITTTYTVKIFYLNREIVLNSTIPREILIISKISIFVYKFLIELTLCLLLGIYFGVFSSKLFFLFIPLLMGFIAFSFGIGLVLALIYCFVIDIEHIWMLASRLYYFVTPVFYTLNDISPNVAKLIYWGNPLSSFLIAFRSIFMSTQKFSVFDYWYSIGLGFICMIVGYCIFLSIENIAVERV